MFNIISFTIYNSMSPCTSLLSLNTFQDKLCAKFMFFFSLKIYSVKIQTFIINMSSVATFHVCTLCTASPFTL